MRVDKNSFERIKVRINRQSSQQISTVHGKRINCVSSVDNHMIRVIIVSQSAEEIQG